MDQKAFSIIIATYNCGQKIEKTIESILCQKKDLFELIIIDGASTDETLNSINKYKNELTLISEKDEGVYYAFNRAIDLATGRYLYFIGAGDCLRDGILEQIDKVLKPEDLSFLYGDVYFVKQQIYQTGERSKSNLCPRLLCQQSIFYDRRIFELFGKYDLEYKIFADSALTLKCFGNEQIKKQYFSGVIADYEEGGLSDTTEDPNFQKDLPRLVRTHLGIRYYVNFMLLSDVYYTLYLPFCRPFVRPVMISIKNLKARVFKNKKPRVSTS